MTENQPEPKLIKTIISDIGQLFRDIFSGAFFRMISNDMRELHAFYIDQDRKKRLESMNRFKRWFLIFFWLIKALILKLSSFRRSLFILALVFILSGSSERADNKIIIGLILFIFILLMELKDKLLARQELEAGRAVQKALLPDENPDVPGWDIWLYSKPANDVGGDLVDFISIDKKRFGIVLGDVAGKGLGAALFMAKLQSTLRALVFNFKLLAKLAESMNNIFYRDTIPNSFSSMFYIEISPGSRNIKYINAGHIPPLVIKQNKISTLQKGDQALGLAPDVFYHEQSIELMEGEYLLVYSDGLSEAMNANGFFFGDERIIQNIEKWDNPESGQAGQFLLDDIERFAGDVPQTDDLSMVILKKVGSKP
jgi:sigma-B regulation protein RsbU (phosphoserine phosphatase)